MQAAGSIPFSGERGRGHTGRSLSGFSSTDFERLGRKLALGADARLDAAEALRQPNSRLFLPREQVQQLKNPILSNNENRTNKFRALAHFGHDGILSGLQVIPNEDILQSNLDNWIFY